MSQAPHLKQLNLTPQVTEVSCTGAMVTVHTGHRGEVSRGGHRVAVVHPIQVPILHLLVLQLEPEATEEARGWVSLISGWTFSTSLVKII